MEETMQLELESFINLCHRSGENIPVYLCGKKVSTKEVADAVVKEEGTYTYMADVVYDDNGNISKVCYDRIKTDAEYS